MEKEPNLIKSPAPFLKRHSKGNDNLNDLQNSIKKDLIFICYDQDSGDCFVEISLANRKSEINPVGYRIIFFDTLTEALRVKAKIARRPHLAGRYLNIL